MHQLQLQFQAALHQVAQGRDPDQVAPVGDQSYVPTAECVEVRLSEDAGSEFGASWELCPPSSVGDVGVARAST